MGAIPYFLIYVILIYLTIKRKYSLIICCVLIIFSAIRFDVGWDYFEYYKLATGNYVYELDRFEIIPKYLLLLSDDLNFPFLFFFVCSFFTIYLVYIALKNQSINPSFSLLIYFSIPVFYMESFSTIRFHLALSIVFWASLNIIKRKYVLSFLLMILAVNCHKSALIGFLFFIFCFCEIGRNFNLILLITSYFSPYFLLNFLLSSQFSTGAEWYIERAGQTIGFTLLPILFLSLNVFHLYYYNKFIKYDTRLRYYIFIFNIGCCIMNFFSFEATLSSRLSKFFIIYILLILPYYSCVFNCKKNVQRLVYIFLFFCFFFNLYNSSRAFTQKKVEKDQYIPYKVIFMK